MVRLVIVEFAEEDSRIAGDSREARDVLHIYGDTREFCVD